MWSNINTRNHHDYQEKSEYRNKQAKKNEDPKKKILDTLIVPRLFIQLKVLDCDYNQVMTDIEPKSILYCGICSWPPEFCEFGITKKKCQTWLNENHPDLYQSVYPTAGNLSTANTPDELNKKSKPNTTDKKDITGETTGGEDGSNDDIVTKKLLEKGVSELSISKEEKLQQELNKRAAKEELKLERKQLEKISNSKIIIKKISRNKKKSIVSISGLEILETTAGTTGTSNNKVSIKSLQKKFSSKFATGTSVVKNAENKSDILIQGDVFEEVHQFIVNLLQEQGLNDIKIELTDDKLKKKK